MDDPEFVPKKMEKYFNDFTGLLHELLTDYGVNIWRYADQWTIDLSRPGEVERRMESAFGPVPFCIQLADGAKKGLLRRILRVSVTNVIIYKIMLVILDVKGCTSSRRVSSFQPVTIPQNSGSQSYLTSCILWIDSRMVDRSWSSSA